MVEPSRDTPPKRPRARDQERISAFIATSVSADAVRPTGPAAADASAPNLTLLDRTEFAPFSFMTNRTKSVSSPPIWRPMPPPSKANIAGALHGPPKVAPFRHVMPPRPYSPATINPAFLTDGYTTTHAALSRRSRGIPLSGVPRISFNTV